MKFRSWLLILLVVLLTVAFIPPVFGCELALTPEQSTISQNGTLEMMAYRRQIHKKCIINMDDISIQATNCVIDQQTIWSKEGTLWSKKLTVSFPNVGDAFVKIVYDCEKHPGDIVPFTAKIIVEAPAPKEDPPPQDPTPPPETPKPEPNPPGENPIPPVAPNNPPKENPTLPNQVAKPSLNPVEPPNQIKNPSTLPSVETPPIPKPDTPYSQPNKFNMTPDLGTIASTTSPTDSAPTPKVPKSPLSYFLDQSYYLLFMLLVLSMIFYLFKLYQLRLIVNIASLGILGFYLGGCICPLGMIERIGSPGSISSFGIFSLMVLGILFFISLFLGRIFCGWVCPQGALQEVLFHNKKPGKVNTFWRRIFLILPMLVFLASLLIPFFIKTLVLCKVDPFKIPFNQAGPTWLLLLFTVLAIISVFFYRPFCRSICPLGFFLGIGSWLGEKLHLRIIEKAMKCTSCHTCSVSCPVDTRDNFHCIECGDCHTDCKIKEKAKLSARKSKK